MVARLLLQLCGKSEFLHVVTVAEETAIKDMHTKSAYQDGVEAEIRCMEYTCTYVAFTLYNNPAIKVKSKQASGLRCKLASTLSTLKACKI